VPPAEFRKARPRFEAKIRRYAPRSVALLGKRAFSAMMEQPDVAWGTYLAEFAGTTAWLLPNPSGLNKAFPLEVLVEAYSDLRTALRIGSSAWDFRGYADRRLW
jgi:TDG/mug DNA glycosylase family protein